MGWEFWFWAYMIICWVCGALFYFGNRSSFSEQLMLVVLSPGILAFVVGVVVLNLAFIILGFIVMVIFYVPYLCVEGLFTKKEDQ